MAAKKKAASRRRYGKKAQSKVKAAMHERRKGTLRSGGMVPKKKRDGGAEK